MGCSCSKSESTSNTTVTRKVQVSAQHRGDTDNPFPEGSHFPGPSEGDDYPKDYQRGTHSNDGSVSGGGGSSSYPSIATTETDSTALASGGGLLMRTSGATTSIDSHASSTASDGSSSRQAEKERQKKALFDAVLSQQQQQQQEFTNPLALPKEVSTSQQEEEEESDKSDSPPLTIENVEKLPDSVSVYSAAGREEVDEIGRPLSPITIDQEVTDREQESDSVSAVETDSSSSGPISAGTLAKKERVCEAWGVGDGVGLLASLVAVQAPEDPEDQGGVEIGMVIKRSNSSFVSSTQTGSSQNGAFTVTTSSSGKGSTGGGGSDTPSPHTLTPSGSARHLLRLPHPSSAPAQSPTTPATTGAEDIPMLPDRSSRSSEGFISSTASSTTSVLSPMLVFSSLFPRRVKAPPVEGRAPYLRYAETHCLGTPGLRAGTLQKQQNQLHSRSVASSRIRALALSPDESEIAWASCEDQLVKCATIQEDGRGIGNLVQMFHGHQEKILSIAFGGRTTSVGNIIASAGHDCHGVIWNRHCPQVSGAAKIFPHRRTITCINFSNCSQLVVTACTDRFVRVFTLERLPRPRGGGEQPNPLLALYQGHQHTPLHCTFSPNDSVIASTDFNKEIHLWGSRNGQLLQILVGHPKIPLMSSFTPDGQRLISNDDREVRVWNLVNETPSNSSTTNTNGGREGGEKKTILDKDPCHAILSAEDCIPSCRGTSKKTDSSCSTWSYSGVAPGSRLGNTHVVVAATDGSIYMFKIPSSREGEETMVGMAQHVSEDSSDSNLFFTTRRPANPTARRSQHHIQDSPPTPLRLDSSAEVWSHRCRGPVYALCCGKREKIVFGDLHGNVYVTKITEG